MISCAGALSAVFVLVAWMMPGVRRVDIDLPDVEEPKIEAQVEGELKGDAVEQKI